MAKIYALLGRRAARGRLAQAIELERASGARHEMLLIDDDAELVRAVQGTTSLVAVVDPYATDRFSVASVAWWVRKVRPAGLVLYGDFTSRPAQEVVEFARLGVRRIVTLDVDDHPVALRSTLIRAIDDNSIQHLIRQLELLLPPPAFGLVEYALDASMAPLSVSDLAHRFSLSTRQLSRRCSDLGLPPPGMLIRWCRVLHTLRLLDGAGRSLGQVAAVLGFSDAANLRRLVRVVTECSPSELLEKGGITAVQVAFLNMLSPLARHRGMRCLKKT